MQILKYEIKKIFYKKSSIISLIVLGIYLISILFVFSKEIEYTDSAGNTISGIKAVKLLKNEKMKWNGILTEETVRKVIKENTAINSDSKYAGLNESNNNMTKSDLKLSNMKYSRKQGFSDIRNLINNSYGEIHSYTYYLIDNLSVNDAGRFYSNRINKLKKLLSSNESNILTKNEKKYLTNSANTLTTPFKYSYADGWLNALEYSATAIFTLTFVTCILTASIFSVEYQTGSDSILLSTEHGKKKGIVYKLLAGLLSTSLVYWITICIVCGFVFMIFGFEGGNCPIQASSMGWKSFYHITNSQALWMVLLLGYVGCLFIASLAMFLSSKVKTSFATIILIILIIMVPAVIGQFPISGILLHKILNIMPHQMLQGWLLLRTFTLYDIGGKILTPYKLLPTLYGILVILLLPLAYNAFKKHQVA